MTEPSTLLYSVATKTLDLKLESLQTLLPAELLDEKVVQRCRKKRIERVEKYEEGVILTVSSTIPVFHQRRRLSIAVLNKE